MPLKRVHFWLGVAALSVLSSSGAFAQADPTGSPTFLSPHSSPIAFTGGLVLVANTAADTLDVIDSRGRDVLARVPVGIDPVSVAVRPDGFEAWVSNHVSDSVSVVDLRPSTPTRFQVIATIQDFDPRTKATRFDEPVGIAFAGNAKAYVALSSENVVAVVNVARRKVIRRLRISAQDPRAIAVQGNRLFVLPFESNNQTQLSGCTGAPDGDLCTFTIQSFNNVLSDGLVVDLVRQPRVPDRDLYVFDTNSDRLVEVVESIGTLLYGLTIDSRGNVFVAQTDARNDANGRAGTLNHGLREMENRPFLNRISRVSCTGLACAAPDHFDLEPLPPLQPAAGSALATPFAVQISPDDSILVATAASSDALFTLDALSGEVLGRVTVGSVPRGVALEASEGALARAWVFDAVDNTVSIVNLEDPSAPRVEGLVRLEDPTPPGMKRGRRAFNTAGASTTQTFSCASCHPDGNTDQLLWVLDTPIPDGQTQVPPRNTMPARGLRNSAPYHWDGIPGDPFGGNNTGNIGGAEPPNCDFENPQTCTRFLVDAALASTMCKIEECDGGRLSPADRRSLARFLLAVPYPPAQRRSYSNALSPRAVRGFEVFHIEGVPENGSRNVCGDCHRMPFWVSTNTPGTGMDAPTWRGAYDRWLILPQGRQNMVDHFTAETLAEGIDERSLWVGEDPRSPLQPVWNMVTEGSTGFSGAFARQVTLGRATARKPRTESLLAALELADSEGAVVLRGFGVWIRGDIGERAVLDYQSGVYVDGLGGEAFTREQLSTLASSGSFVGTFTGWPPANTGLEHPQPAIWSLGPIEQQRGRQEFPVLSGGSTTMTVSSRDVDADAQVFVDGRHVQATVECTEGPTSDCRQVEVRLLTLPSQVGTHFLQLQNPRGLFSNEFLFEVAATDSNGSAAAADQEMPAPTTAPPDREECSLFAESLGADAQSPEVFERSTAAGLAFLDRLGMPGMASASVRATLCRAARLKRAEQSPLPREAESGREDSRARIRLCDEATRGERTDCSFESVRRPLRAESEEDVRRSAADPACAGDPSLPGCLAAGESESDLLP